MKLFSSKTFYLSLFIILVGAASAYGIYFFKISKTGSVKTLQEYADQIVVKCSKESYKPTCYDTEIPKLMDYISMQDAFQVTRLVQDEDKSYVFCHVLGHNLSARETKKDPSKWADVVTECPSGLCSNGCIHGAFQERFRTEALDDSQINSILPQLQGVCEERQNWHPTGMEQASCYHALGHLLMYITEADAKKSNDLCQKVAVKPDGRNFLQVCYDGNFMQIFQPLEDEDFALVKNIAPHTPAAAFKLCDKFSSIPAASCHNESWPLSRSQILTPDGLVKFCSFTRDQNLKNRCLSAMFFVIPVQVNFDQPTIETLCRALPQNIKGQCFADSASRFIETDYRLIDKSVAFCRAAEEFGVGDTCYNELLFYSKYNFHQGSSDFINMCNALPEPWKTKCFK